MISDHEILQRVPELDIHQSIILSLRVYKKKSQRDIAMVVARGIWGAIVVLEWFQFTLVFGQILDKRLINRYKHHTMKVKQMV